MYTSIRNGMPMTDTDGKPMHAHGAGFLEDNGYYYMFGEVRDGDKRVACYRSKDLMNWEFRNVVLRINSKVEPHYVRTDLNLKTCEKGANIERPKVLYCEKTKQYVMWMHFENGVDYCAARCAIATCDTVDGDYVYRGSFNPVGNDARDCTLYKDKDGTAYFFASGRDNADMCVYRLSDDYMSVDEQVKALWPGQYREAPAVFEKNGKYYMLSSMCTGWNPNQGGVASAYEIEGRWSSIGNFGDTVTYNSQPTAVVKFGDNFVYVADRWDPMDYNNSGYIFLPITIENGECKVEWADEISFDVKTKTYSTFSIESDDYRIMTNNYTSYLSFDGQDIVTRNLAYKDESLLWNFEQKGDWFGIVHKKSGKALAADGTLKEVSSNPSMLWKIEEYGDCARIVNVETGRVFDVYSENGKTAAYDEKRGFVRIIKKY